MSTLLDTHIFVWWLTEPQRLASHQRQAVEDRSAPVFVSAVTAWEIAIKVNLGKWPGAAALMPDLAKLVQRSGLQPLHVNISHAERAGMLDLAHRDPFDRLLAAQALELDIPIMSVDPAFRLLGCKII